MLFPVVLYTCVFFHVLCILNKKNVFLPFHFYLHLRFGVNHHISTSTQTIALALTHLLGLFINCLYNERVQDEPCDPQHLTVNITSGGREGAERFY